jgi:hypothetical protein
MATWADVCDLAERLPGTVLGQAHEGSPAWYAGRHTFARLRWDDQDQDLVQVWSGDMDTGRALASRSEVFPVIQTFEYRVSVWGRLDLLEREELAELVLDSYDIRGGRRRRGGIGLADLLS